MPVAPCMSPSIGRQERPACCSTIKRDVRTQALLNLATPSLSRTENTCARERARKLTRTLGDGAATHGGEALPSVAPAARKRGDRWAGSQKAAGSGRVQHAQRRRRQTGGTAQPAPTAGWAQRERS